MSKLAGLDDVLKNLNNAVSKIEGATVKSMTDAALFIEGESIELVPVDTGNLKNSSFTKVTKVNRHIHAVIGYTAKYAPWVHEMPMKLKGQPRANFGRTSSGQAFGGGTGRGRYWDSGENKFLEKAIKRNIPEILRLISGPISTVVK